MKISKNIFQTLVVRGGVAVINMAVVFLTLNVLGADGRGKISLFLTDIMLISMVTSVLANSTVSYHVPKTNIKPLVKTGLLWVLMISLAMGVVLSFLHREYLQKHLFPISLLTGLITMNQMILIGKEKIKEYNIVFVLDPFLRLLVLLVGFYAFKIESLTVFLTALYIALGLSLVVSTMFVFKIVYHDVRKIEIKSKEVFKYGMGTELSSFIQFFNYRLLFYVVFYQLGSVELGWFSVAVSVAESLWIISRSITVNQYSKILNTTDKLKQRIITNKSAILSFVMTLGAVLLLVVVPKEFLSLIIKKDLSNIQEIIWILCPGVLMIAVSNVWGHYFSGRGKYQINNLKSLVGFLLMITAAYFLTPKFGMIGVVSAMLLGYLGSSLTLFGFYLADKKK
ncbi:lipopolysaccharide biosynthesis protein [Wenyingzhuangia sp. IMCC45467]